MSTSTDIRQLRSRATLTRTTGAADSPLSTIIQALEKEITPPLAMSPTTVVSLVLNIGNIAVVNPSTSLNHTIPPISNLLPSFTSGTITLSSTGAGSATPSVGSALALGMTASQFMKIGICIDATGSLTLTKGTAASSLGSAGAPAVVSGLFAIGYFVARTDASNNTQNIIGSDIYQYTGSSGPSGGTGNASSVLETLKNQFVDSPYELLTPVIVSSDAATKFGTLTGAAYDLVTNTIKFTANSQVATSIQMLDSAEFLSRGLDVGSVDLSIFWNLGTTLQAFSVPSAFTYEVSRDGGTNWFTVAMSQVGTTNTFRGPLRFDTSTTTEATKQTILAQATADANRVLNATTQQSIGQQFTLTATTKLQEVVIAMAKAGSPTGNFFVSLIRDNAGVPSTSLADILCQSNAIPLSGVASGPANVTVDIPDTVLIAGTYHAVVSTDATYKASFVSTTTELRLREKQTSSSAPFVDAYNGTSWATATTNSNLTMTLNGRALDLRVRVTSAGSPTYPCGLDGFGIFYNLVDVGVVGGINKQQQFVFNSVTDNTSAFTITAFNPSVQLLRCYYVERGQVFRAPAFSLSGNVATFPTNAFYNSGVSETVTLVFDQTDGSTFDSADQNARILSSSHLGSTSATDDMSLAGRGPLLRDAAGTLRELELNSTGYPVVLATPGGSVLRDTTTPSTMDDTAATRLGQKTYLHGTTYNGGIAPTVTLTGGGGTLSAVDLATFIPYQMQDGSWRMKLNVATSVSSTTRTNLTLSINGITFSTIGVSDGQGLGGGNGNSLATAVIRTSSGGSTIFTAHASGSTSDYMFSGDVALASKPTWAY